MPPSANDYWRTRAFMSQRTGKPMAMTYVSEAAKEYKQEIIDLVGPAEMIRSEIIFTVRVFRPKRIGDLDNRLKVLLDALQGVIFADDKQVVEIHAFRFEDKTNPRVEVEICPKGLC